MTRRTAFRQRDVERAIRAARLAGAERVVVQLDGSLAIEWRPATGPDGREVYPERRSIDDKVAVF